MFFADADTTIGFDMNELVVVVFDVVDIAAVVFNVELLEASTLSIAVAFGAKVVVSDLKVGVAI